MRVSACAQIRPLAWSESAPPCPCEAQVRPTSAFTLIELMVVLVLIGVLSAMILPEMKGTYGDALLRSSARDLVNVFSIAYSRAVSFNQVHVVRFERASGRYEIEREAPSRRAQPEFMPLKDVAGSSGDLDSRIKIEIRRPTETETEGEKPEANDSVTRAAEDQPGSGPDTLSFYPDGTADAAEVVLRDEAGFGLRLRIDPITARVEILELDSKSTDEYR